jgi:hypothetical protein
VVGDKSEDAVFKKDERKDRKQSTLTIQYYAEEEIICAEAMACDGKIIC